MLICSLSQKLQGFSTIPGAFLAGFLNHQAVGPVVFLLVVPASGG